MNIVCLSGRLVKDPEPKEIKDHLLVSFSVAVDGIGKNAKTSFFDCECWDKTAEFVGNYLTKGNPIILQGRLQQDTWEKDGQKFSKVKIVALQVESVKPAKSEGKSEPKAETNEGIPF